MPSKAAVWKLAAYVLPFMSALGGAVYGSGKQQAQIDARLVALEKTQRQCEKDHDILLDLNSTMRQVNRVLLRIEPMLPKQK